MTILHFFSLILATAAWPVTTIYAIVASMIHDMLGGPAIYLFGLAIIGAMRMASRILIPLSIYALAGVICYAAVASASVIIVGPHHDTPVQHQTVTPSH